MLRSVHLLSRILFCVMTLAALAFAPLGMQHAPSLQENRLAALSLYGISTADICGTEDAAGNHTHCESCLTQALATPAQAITLLGNLARRAATRPSPTCLTHGRLARAAHPIRAPPSV